MDPVDRIVKNKYYFKHRNYMASLLTIFNHTDRLFNNLNHVCLSDEVILFDEGCKHL